MNRKELRKHFTDDWFNDEGVEFEPFFNKLWKEIEQYGKEQRIGENQKYYNALTEMYYSKDGNPDDKIILYLRKLFENRIKELKDE
ncbi:hypothetical protein LCGC14_2193470 [marine sediment metagenome]|uniref:Uncharacterized protein n=1 Tax=marine sediment metagenome TaxID=412755 RepID=A0A0F9FWA1_9ZZZZ